VARTLGGAPRQPSPVVTTTAAAGPRTLVSTDSVEDGEQVVRLLKDDFAQVQLSVRAGARPGGLDAGDPHALGRAIDQLRQKQVEATRGLAVPQHRAPAQVDAQPARADRAVPGRDAAPRREGRRVARRADGGGGRGADAAADLAGARSAAYEIPFVGDAPEALNLLRRVCPDAILMDIRLPGIDGVSLTERLKASPALADIPIIMMSGDARLERLVRSMEVGAAAFVVKPFTRESLTMKVEKVLKG
jgi:CheY-like chemotaxis protein